MENLNWQLDTAKNGLPIVRIHKRGHVRFLHSRYDPEKEAMRWVEHQTSYVPEILSRFVVIGMGAGYHVKALRDRFPATPIDVWDFNERFGKWLGKVGLLSWLSDANSRVTYRCTESLADFRRYVSNVMLDGRVHMLIHPPSLELIPDSLTQLKLAFEEQLLQRRAFFAQEEKLDQNFRQNLLLQDPGISAWLHQYRDMPMVLASAGPSLTKQIGVLKEAKLQKKRDFILGCVGTALIPLLKKGLSPDFVMVSDANDMIIEQFYGVDTAKRPLFYLSTANHQTVKNYRGPRFIVWQKGYEPAEKEALAREEPVVETGGSVATCLLDVMVKMGGHPIALVGQDLAFTDGWSHAADAHAQRKLSLDAAFYEVENFDRNGKVKTSLNLLSYLRWFERYVEARIQESGNEDQRFWNCTEGGAYIQGWKHAPLSEFLEFQTR